jgi:ERF superfamily protein
MNLQSEQINEIVAALAKAQGEITVAVYDSANPHFKSKYASYEAIRKASQGALSKNGLTITHQLSQDANGKRIMVTQLSHISGQWMRSSLILPCDKETPQSIGSSITYAKRYTYSSLLAMSSDEDEDGEEAEKPYRASNNTAFGNAVVKQPLPIDMISTELAQEIENELGDRPKMREGMLKTFGATLFTEVSMKDYMQTIKPSLQAARKVTK